jgi:predicted dehydrogenase
MEKNNKKKLKIVLLGCGGMMGAHVNRLKQMSEVEIIGLCDVNMEILKKFVEHNIINTSYKPKLFTNALEMYNVCKPDAVFISTPHTQHYQQGIQALDAGCHVFMEKPMVTKLEEAYKLDEKVKNTGKILVVGYNSSCSPEFNYLRNIIRNKTLGKLELVSGHLSQDWLRFTIGTWRQNPVLSGGGQAYDSGAHIFNSLCWSVESDIEEVFSYVDNHGTPVDINSVSSIKFTNGVLANITIGGNCPGGSSFMGFFFDEGHVEIDGWGGSFINVWKGPDKLKYPLITPEMGAISPDHNFIDAILGRVEALTTVKNGVVQSQLMECFYESQRTGQPAKPKQRFL